MGRLFKRSIMWPVSGYRMQICGQFPLRVQGPFQEVAVPQPQRNIFLSNNTLISNSQVTRFFSLNSIYNPLIDVAMIRRDLLPSLPTERPSSAPPLPRERPPSAPPLPTNTPPPSPNQHARCSSSTGRNVRDRAWRCTGMKGMFAPPGDGWTQLTVASYNILAQVLLEDHKDLYRHCPYEYLEWDYRKHNLLSEIASYLPDILCMQEVQADHYDNWFLPKMSELGYGGEYLKRSGDKHDGCATFYRREKLVLHTARPVQYLIPGVAVLNRDNVGLVLVLTPAHCESRAKICVANTHLLFNPKRGDVKLAQLQLLFAEIDKLAYKEGHTKRNRYDNEPPVPLYHPVIVCGDFNALPGSKLYDFVRDGDLHYEGMPAKMISGQVRNASSHPELKCPIIPDSLGISDQCQFIDTFRYRYKLINSDFIDTNEIEELRHMHDLEVKEKHRRHTESVIDTPRKRATAHRQLSSSKKKKDFSEVLSEDGITECKCNDMKAAGTVGGEQGAHALCKHRHSSVHTQPKPLANELGTTSTGHSDSDAFKTVHSKRHKVTDIHVDLRRSNRDAHKVVIARDAMLGTHQLMHKEHLHAQHNHDAYIHLSGGSDTVASRDAGLTKTERVLHAHCSTDSGRLCHALRLSSVYDHYRHIHGTRRPEATTCHGRANYTVDYIFFHRGNNADKRDPHLRLVKKLDLFTDEDMFQLGGLPQRQLSSDHIVLMAGFHWKIGSQVKS